MKETFSGLRFDVSVSKNKRLQEVFTGNLFCVSSLSQ